MVSKRLLTSAFLRDFHRAHLPRANQGPSDFGAKLTSVTPLSEMHLFRRRIQGRHTHNGHHDHRTGLGGIHLP